MKTRGLSLALMCFAVPLVAQTQPSSVAPKVFPAVQGKTYKFERVANGVYYASGGFGSNNTVVVNDDDVLIVDTGTTPAAARAFVDDIKMITDKPVRYVVNTHWHYDHTDGNSIFEPEVKIIAHDFVREALTTFDVLHREPFLTSQGTAVPARIAGLKKQIAEARDPARRAALANDLAAANERDFFE
jgi:cyclase